MNKRSGLPRVTLREEVTLTKDVFFFVEDDNYDDHAELAIPCYREMHQEALRLFPEREGGAFRVLDLGSGTGKTAYFVLDAFPRSTVRCVELFEEMESRARNRLESFGDRVEYVLGDYMEADLGSGYDVCVAALAIHHQTAIGKRHLFGKVFDALRSGGRFILIDWALFEDSMLQSVAFRVAEEHVKAAVRDQGIVDAWIEHWHEKNRPDTSEDMILWLKEAGFAFAACVVRYYGMVLICGEKV